MWKCCSENERTTPPPQQRKALPLFLLAARSSSSRSYRSVRALKQKIPASNHKATVLYLSWYGLDMVLAPKNSISPEPVCPAEEQGRVNIPASYTFAEEINEPEQWRRGMESSAEITNSQKKRNKEKISPPSAREALGSIPAVLGATLSKAFTVLTLSFQRWGSFTRDCPCISLLGSFT